MRSHGLVFRDLFNEGVAYPITWKPDLPDPEELLKDPLKATEIRATATTKQDAKRGLVARPIDIRFLVFRIHDHHPELRCRISFTVDDKQDATGEGDAIDIFATVTKAVETFLDKYETLSQLARLEFSAERTPDRPSTVRRDIGMSRVNLYMRFVNMIIDRDAGWKMKSQPSERGKKFEFKVHRGLSA